MPARRAQSQGKAPQRPDQNGKQQLQGMEAAATAITQPRLLQREQCVPLPLDALGRRGEAIQRADDLSGVYSLLPNEPAIRVVVVGWRRRRIG